MLNNKRITMILSILLAIGLWAYVVGGIDPDTTELYKGVPITFLNEEALTEQNLAVLAVSDETMDIRLAGQRASVSKVEAEDITATVDLADLTEGEHVIKININVKSSDEVEIEDKSISRVTVVVEEAVSQTRPVRVSFEGEYTQGEEPTAIDVSRNNVTVTGAKSLVERVDHVQATVDATKVTTDMKSFRASLAAVDAHGTRVDNVRLSTSTAYVTA
ncbi:MAG TPA: CdaR family protein, partial [Anaerovoracaceae bacterium]|nr:CdaR family protein [Anaerovoracaceae bacterium]